MKQIQIAFARPEEAEAKLRELKTSTSQYGDCHLLFQIFSASMDREDANRIAKTLKVFFPGADYVGCSTCGSIMNGDLCPHPYEVTCTIFESPRAKTAVSQYHLGRENVDEVIQKVVDFANANAWVKAIMLYTTVWETSMSSLCDRLDGVRGDVAILGGGAFNESVQSSSSYVLSSVDEAADHSIVFAFIGGPDFSIQTRYISGWKPLGKMMEITKAQGNILQEIEGLPAFETYRRYLKIENDETFLFNTLEFPYMIHGNGVEILRHPQQCLADGSLVMASDVESARMIRMAYGDPVTIMESVFRNVYEIRREKPDVIAIFSCAGRKSFWGDSEIGNETRAFQSIAPSAGFYTLSEFLRTGENVNQHNLTLVIASMKEAFAGKAENAPEQIADEDHTKRRISTVERLANFIEEATRELEVANEQLSDMNQRLSDMAITDGMTGIYNRSEIQRRITVACEECAQSVALIMIDIDDFKKVNDTFGHKEGDEVIKALASLMKRKTADIANASVGRWGGEEFMILLEGCGVEQGMRIAEDIRAEFQTIAFPMAGHKTISVGVTAHREGEDSESTVLRVDQALYTAKTGGKNQTVHL